jgi:hypothetical protein
MIYEIDNEDLILKEINKLKKINYNQFKWWRKFDKTKKPLPNNSLLRHRIENGDFEFSHFFWQAKFSELEINRKYIECKKDLINLLEKHSVEFGRRKRLWLDFEKHEWDLLNELKKQFINEFIISEEQYKHEIENFDGTTIEFYVDINKRYEIRKQPLKRRGRPSKTNNI